MNLTILGCGPAFANPGGASSGYLVSHHETRVLVDCGHGVVGKLRAITDPMLVTAIVISHMHPDHFFDLVPLKYLYYFSCIPPVPLWLPPGGKATLRKLQRAVGLADDFFDESFQVEEFRSDRGLPLRDLQAVLVPTHHFIPAYAMRFQTSLAPSRDLFYSSDTGWSEAVLDLARGSKLAVVESAVFEYENEEVAEGHLTGALAGKLANEAGVERLLLTHYDHHLAERLLTSATESFGLRAELATEGTTYQV